MTVPNTHLVAPALGHPAISDAESFGSAVWLWMQAAKLHDRPLYALDRMLLPAIQLGQYVLVMEIDDAGAKHPIAYLGWANLSAEASARFMHHRSHERGVRVGHLVGTDVTARDAHAWWKQRPILSVTKPSRGQSTFFKESP